MNSDKQVWTPDIEVVDILDKHGDIHACNRSMPENVHYFDKMRFYTHQYSRRLLGTIGKRAPFHSQMQKRTTIKQPENKGARTTADAQGKVTPP